MNILRITTALILIISVAHPTTTNAQINDNTAQFGIKGGINFSNLYVNEVDDNNVLTSFNAGIYTSLPLTSFIAIQPEFLYSRKGAELTYNNLLARGTAKFSLNYIEIPLLLKINIGNLNVHAGPYVAYLLDANIKNVSASGGFDFEENFNNDDFNKFDTGIAAGFGFDFSGLGIGARYNYGLSTVGKKRDIGGGIFNFPDGKNSNLSLYIALNLN